MTTTLVIPAYNEAKRLQPFLASIVAYTRQYPNELTEIIVVDDGSSDNTADVARKFTEQLPMLRVISYRPNRGKGAAIQAGVQAATGELVIFMDADGATDITELPKMLSALTSHDVAVGSRWLKESNAKRSSWFRHIAGVTYRFYMQLFGIGEIDTMCGFKGYRLHVAQDLFKDLLESRWLFDTEVAYKAIRRGYSIANFPIKWESKDGSKLSTTALLKTAFEIWPLMRKIKRQERTR